MTTNDDDDSDPVLPTKKKTGHKKGPMRVEGACSLSEGRS
jgi:hypothetical protein